MPASVPAHAPPKRSCSSSCSRHTPRLHASQPAARPPVNHLRTLDACRAPMLMPACPGADVTVGGWMLAFNTTHMDDRRLCMDHCDPSSIGVYDMPQCAGLCDAVKSLPELYGSPACSDSAVHFDATELPRIRPIFRFQRQHW